MNGILDTNIIIHYDHLAQEQLDLLPAEPAITAVTLAELMRGPVAAKKPETAAVRQHLLERATKEFPNILPFDELAAVVYGQVFQDVLNAGQKPKSKQLDLLIACIAISRGLPLYTMNPKDFSGIKGLNMVEVPPV